MSPWSQEAVPETGPQSSPLPHSAAQWRLKTGSLVNEMEERTQVRAREGDPPAADCLPGTPGTGGAHALLLAPAPAEDSSLPHSQSEVLPQRGGGCWLPGLSSQTDIPDILGP